MTRRLLDTTRGAVAFAATLAILTVVPYGLHTFGGTPGGDLVRAVTDSLASDNGRTELLLRGGLVLIAWCCWAQLAYALIIEIAAAVRGGVARTAPLLPGIQAFAARLVATATLIVTSLAPPMPAYAAPLTPTANVAYEYATPAVLNSSQYTSAVRTTSPTIARVSAPSYVVQGRDTFWNLADRFLGDGLRWRELRDANLGRTMADGAVIGDTTETLHAGWDLTLPANAVLPLATVEPVDSHRSSATGTVDVEAGDNLWTLAKHALADAWGRTPSDRELGPFWADMVDLNRERLLPPGDPNLIYAGQHLVLPAIPPDPHVTPERVVPAPKSTPPPTVPPTTTVMSAPSAPVSTTTAQPVAPRTSTTVTPAPTTPTTPAPHESSHQGGGVDMRTIALGIGGLATGAGALAVTLRRLRAHQAARRLPGTVIDSPPAEAVAYETRIRPIATVEAVRWLAATNQFLTHRLAQHPEHALPSVIAARVGQFGVELLLDEACAPVDGFVDAGADATAWRLHPDLDLDSIEVEAADAQPYSPALVPVGTTEAGDLHLDLEQLAVIALEGEPDAITGWLRTIAADIATVPWARHCEIVAIGVSDELAALDRVTVPDDPTAWAERFALEMGHLNVRLDATPYEHRVNQGEVFHPTIVLIGQGHDTIARQLAEVAALINTPVAVIAAAVLPVGARVHLTATAATLEPSGLDFVPALTSSDELGHLAALLGAAGDPESSAYEPTTVGMGGSGVDAEMSADDGPETADVNDGGSELPVAELIATITRKRPIEVQILTPRPRVRGLGKQPQAKAESLIAYLAYHRSISSQTLREAFWPTGTNRSTADNALSQIRQLLGTQRDGSHRLTAATNTGRYELSDDVGCDWTKAQALIAAAARRGSNDTIELLRAGLQLVEGRIAADTVGRSYTWLQDDYEVYGLMERVLVDAAHQLGELALEAGDHELARWAAMKGLAVVPGQESLYRIQMRAAATAGDTQGVIDAFRSATGAAHNIDPLSDVQPETDELRRRLVDRAT